MRKNVYTRFHDKLEDSSYQDISLKIKHVNLLVVLDEKVRDHQTCLDMWWTDGLTNHHWHTLSNIAKNDIGRLNISVSFQKQCLGYSW